jgi:hypothetical protein
MKRVKFYQAGFTLAEKCDTHSRRLTFLKIFVVANASFERTNYAQ